MVQMYIIDKSDLPNLIQGKDLALGQGNKFRAFCIKINGELTNGDVIKAVFPNISKYNNMLLENHSTNILFDDEWWNAPYKVGDTDGNS